MTPKEVQEVCAQICKEEADSFVVRAGRLKRVDLYPLADAMIALSETILALDIGEPPQDVQRTVKWLRDARSAMQVEAHLEGKEPLDVQDAGSLLSSAADLIESLSAQVQNWTETARDFSNGMQYYRGLVVKIGGHFGVAARTSDDGSIQDDVLCAKVPELVESLSAQLADITKNADYWNQQYYKMAEKFNEQMMRAEKAEHCPPDTPPKLSED